MSSIFLRELKGEKGEMSELQYVLECSPRYFLKTTGYSPGPSEAQSQYSILPDGKTYEDKYIFGIFKNDTMIGCADIIRRYPDDNKSLIGLFLIIEELHGLGIGHEAYYLLEQNISQWEECNTLRLGVLESDKDALDFWHSTGFQNTGIIKSYNNNKITDKIVVFEKIIKTLK